MLKFSKQLDYGLLAIDYLLGQPAGRVTSAHEIAKAHRIPEELLGKVLQKLARGGIIRSRHGTRGGYVVVRQPAEIALFDVVCAVEGPVGVVDCFNARRVQVLQPRVDDGCRQFETCSIRTPMGRVQRKLLDLLRTTTLAEVRSPSGGVAR